MSVLPEIDDNTALLIVDVQQGFMNEHSCHLPALIEGLQPRYKTVIATKFYNAPDSAFRTLMNWHRFEKDTEETALAFQPLAHVVVIEKQTYGCVTDSFLRLLQEHDIKTVHLAGCDTNMCVMQSAVGLFETNRYRPVVLAPYCASHSGPQYHESGLELLEKAIGPEQIWKSA